MEVEIAFNELSIGRACDLHTACKWLSGIATLIAYVGKTLNNSRITLRSPVAVLNEELCNGWSIYKLLVTRDRRLLDSESLTFLLSVLINKPYIDHDLTEHEQEILTLSEIQYSNRKCVGLLFAFKNQNLCVSLPSSPTWNSEFIKGELSEIIDGIITTAAVRIRHASDISHVNTHLDWLKNQSTIEIRDGQALLKAFPQIFPNLLLLGNTRTAIDGLYKSDQKIKHLIHNLQILQEYCRTWPKSQEDRIETIRSMGIAIRSESKATLEQFGDERQYTDPEGTIRTSNWHFSINPGTWRGYIDWDESQHNIWLTYLGPHLSTHKFR